MNIISIKINGEAYRLKLTLGALAAIETALGGDLAAASDRLKNPNVNDVISIIHALVVGGGGQISIEGIKGADIDFADAAIAVSRVFENFAPDQNGEAPGKPMPPHHGKTHSSSLSAN